MYKGIVDMAELKILNNRSGMIFNLIKKNHMAVMIREGQDASQTFTDASIFIDKEQAKQIMIYLSEFISYDGKSD